MILTMDIGNTNIKIGVFDGSRLREYWRLATKTTYTSDELGVLVSSLFENRHLDRSSISGIMLSSVVPTINFTVEHMCRDYFGIDPVFVAPGIKTGVDIRYENPRELGSDRICNAVGTLTEYGAPAIFIDFGTATTFGVLDREGVFLGGCICPGIRLASDALVSGTAKLPHFELIQPAHVIGKNTIANMQSGIIYGYVGQINYLITKIREEIGEPEAQVIATGGFARLIAEESGMITRFDGLLTLKGLNTIYQKNFTPNRAEMGL